MRYFYVLSADYFHSRLAPAIAASWRLRSFEPISRLSSELHHRTDLPFRTDLWRQLVGELLLSQCSDLPELETPLELFGRLCGQELVEDRDHFSPLQQVCLGCRDLCLGGGYYRPEHAGWNDFADVCRLAEWLRLINSEEWSAVNLTGSSVQEQNEELAFAQEWFQEISGMYGTAKIHRCVIVSELV